MDVRCKLLYFHLIVVARVGINEEEQGSSLGYNGEEEETGMNCTYSRCRKMLYDYKQHERKYT